MEEAVAGVKETLREGNREVLLCLQRVEIFVSGQIGGRMQAEQQQPKNDFVYRFIPIVRASVFTYIQSNGQCSVLM